MNVVHSPDPFFNFKEDLESPSKLKRRRDFSTIKTFFYTNIFVAFFAACNTIAKHLMIADNVPPIEVLFWRNAIGIGLSLMAVRKY
jgi:hypothetical protein